MEKKRLDFSRFSLFAVICLFLITGCQSGPGPGSASVSGKEEGDIKMSGTAWVFSVPKGGSIYTFKEDTYEVNYSGAMETFNALPKVMAEVGGIEGYGTGTYSVSGREVTLRPKGEMYLIVDSDGQITVQQGDSFTITVKDHSFELGILTYIQLPSGRF